MSQRDPESSDYDADYFGEGTGQAKSCYRGYRYTEETVRDVSAIIAFADLQTGARILDFGCAKGFHVQEFRSRGLECLGCDISAYAIENAPKEVRPFVSHIEAVEIPFGGQFDCIVCKDVLEHLTEDRVMRLLRLSHLCCRQIFAAIPLGDGQRFLVEQYNHDATHILPRSRKWWVNTVAECGWQVVRLESRLDGMKDDWAIYEDGDLFLLGRSARCGRI